MRIGAARPVTTEPSARVDDRDVQEEGAARVAPAQGKLPSPARSLRELYTPRETFALLRRERARADRHGREFSLVLLKVEGCLWPSLPSLRLAKIVQERCRATDEVGRFDVEYLCAILPDTGPAGAWRFAAGVCDKAQERLLRPLCAVYTYPNAWFKDQQEKSKTDGPILKIVPDDEAVSHRTDASAQNSDSRVQHAAALTSARGEAKPVGGQALLPYVLDGIEAGLSDRDMELQIEALLVRPMPMWKRALDLLGACIALLLLSPVMLVAALAIKFGSRGPVVFKQHRAGLGGKPFTIFKFRTMCVDAEDRKASLRPISEQDGPAFKLTDDPRVTTVGKLLRATSIDELPQLWNVLRGDMSLVGPRPLPLEESNNCDLWHRQRLEVTPGLTCIWQIEGRSRVTFDEWMRMDARYIRRRRLWHDVWLLIKTIPAVIFSRGAR